MRFICQQFGRSELLTAVEVLIWKCIKLHIALTKKNRQYSQNSHATGFGVPGMTTNWERSRKNHSLPGQGALEAPQPMMGWNSCFWRNLSLNYPNILSATEFTTARDERIWRINNSLLMATLYLQEKYVTFPSRFSNYRFHLMKTKLPYFRGLGLIICLIICLFYLREKICSTGKTRQFREHTVLAYKFRFHKLTLRDAIVLSSSCYKTSQNLVTCFCKYLNPSSVQFFCVFLW